MYTKIVGIAVWALFALNYSCGSTNQLKRHESCFNTIHCRLILGDLNKAAKQETESQVQYARAEKEKTDRDEFIKKYNVTTYCEARLGKCRDEVEAMAGKLKIKYPYVPYRHYEYSYFFCKNRGNWDPKMKEFIDARFGCHLSGVNAEEFSHLEMFDSLHKANGVKEFPPNWAESLEWEKTNVQWVG